MTRCRTIPESCRHACGRTLLTLLVLMLGCALTCWGARPTDLMSQALKKRGAGDLPGAITLLQTALAEAKTPMQRNLARSMIGDCLMEDGQFKAARGTFENILTDSPRRDEKAESLYRIAQTWSQEGNQAKMKAMCHRVIEEFPKSPFDTLARHLLGTPVAVPEPAAPTRIVTTPKPVKPATGPAPAAPKAPAEPVKQLPEFQTAKPAPAKTAATTRPTVAAAAVSVAATQEMTRPSVGPVAAQTVRNLPRPVAAPIVVPSVSSPHELNRLLNLGVISSEERAELATKILRRQNRLKEHPQDPQTDLTLFHLASETARFGELLEACKLYDRLLSQFPSSPHVEDAYFEAIRLRAILRAYRPVLDWGSVFLETFPSSLYKNRIDILTAHAQQQLAAQNQSRPASAPARKAAVGQAATQRPSPKKSARDSKIVELPRYQQAKRRMSEEKYGLALRDFQALTVEYPQEPLLWWELALVQVQQEEYKDAEESLGQLLILDPAHEEGRSLLGYVLYRRKNFQKAAQAYQTTSEEARPTKKGLTFYDAGQAAKRLRQTSSDKSTGPKKGSAGKGEKP